MEVITIGQTIKIEIPVEVVDKSEPALSNITGKLKEMDTAAKQTEKTMEKSGKVSGFEKTFQKMQKSVKGFAKEKYQVALEAKDGVSKVLSKVKSGISSFAGKAKTVTLKAVDMASAPIRGVMNLVKNPLMAAGITLSAGAALGSSVSTFAGFESQMSQVAAISGATQEEFVQLTAEAKEMGATTKFTAQESAEAFNYMAMAGWKTGDMISGISGILSLAAASGEDLGTTSDIVTDALTAFRLQASDAGHFSDVLAQASSNANTNVSMMGESFKYVAPVAGALGYSIEDTSLALGLMANASVKGSMAGTALKTSLANMASPTDNMAAAMEKYGISLTDSEGNMKSLRGVMENLRTSLGGLSETEQTAAASTIFGKEAMAGMLAIINASEADWNKLAAAVDNADGASQRMANTMLDNLSGKLTLFQSALDGVKISLGERMKPYLVEALDWMTDKMPDVEIALMQGMDRIDNFVENTKEKFAEFTATPEWTASDIFGKMHIAWDELIGKPFSDWWSGGGSEMITGKAAQIGEAIGTGVSGGLLALLGIDIGTGINEGASIGASFAQGFINGFDASSVQEAVKGAMSGLLQNAGQIFTGNADASSWASAAAVAKMAIPVMSLIGKGASLGGNIIGGTTRSAQNGLLKKIIGNYSLEEDLSGAVITNATGLKGLAGKAGVALGSGATTAKGLSLAGGGAIAGGVAAGATLISGGMDFYHASKSADKDEKNAYMDSGIYKVGGVATGAIAGATIGSIIPGLGTAIGGLIGAGVGGIAGWFQGNKVKNDYIQAKEAADEAAYAAELMEEKSKYALEGSRFENDKLKSAMEDTTVSASQFGQMMQEAASQKIQDSFGNIKLSMQEIQDAARQIIFDGQDAQMTKFASATSDAKSSMSGLQSAVNSMAKLNWKAGMGLINDEQSVAQYQSGVENMISSAQQYVEDQHYQATAAISLLMKPGTPVDFSSGLNTMYSDIQNQLSSSSEQLHAKLNIALEDGVITLDEQKELSNLQSQITDITSQISEAQSDAGMQALKIKYSGAQLDANSFASLTTELQSQVQEAAGNYDSALEVALTNLNLQLQSGAINQAQFDTQLQALTEGYQANIQKLSVNVESFQLGTIADAFGSELDGILPNLEGSVAERLGEAMHNAMAAGVDVENWDVGTASKWLDLDGLSGETQAAITEMMSQVAATMPDQMVEALDQSGGMGDAVGNMFSQAIETADMSGMTTSLMNKFGESMTEIDMSEAGTGLQEGLQNSLTASLENVDLSGAAEALNSSLGNALTSIDMAESGSGLQEGIQNSITASFEGMDLSGVAEGLSASLSEAISGAEGMDMSGLGESLSASISGAVGSMDFSSVTSAVGSGISSAIEASMGTIQGAISSLYSQVGSAINSAFAAGFTTTTTVTITVNYQLANPTATISFSGGGTGTATVSASIHANGGFVDGPELSWIGEDGPEAIIPLGAKRRGRGIELWNQVGDILGIPQHADGGIFAVTGGNSTTYIGVKEDEDSPTEESKIGVAVDSGKNNVTVSVNLSPEFKISGENPEGIMQMIKSQLKEMVDELSNEIAEQLMDNFSNTPV